MRHPFSTSLVTLTVVVSSFTARAQSAPPSEGLGKPCAMVPCAIVADHRQSTAKNGRRLGPRRKGRLGWGRTGQVSRGNGRHCMTGGRQGKHGSRISRRRSAKRPYQPAKGAGLHAVTRIPRPFVPGPITILIVLRGVAAFVGGRLDRIGIIPAHRISLFSGGAPPRRRMYWSGRASDTSHQVCITLAKTRSLRADMAFTLTKFRSMDAMNPLQYWSWVGRRGTAFAGSIEGRSGSVLIPGRIHAVSGLFR